MKRKGFSFINIFGLAVGMASALLILTYVAFEFSFDKMHSKSARIYRVQSTFHEGEALTDDWATSSFMGHRTKRILRVGRKRHQTY